MNNKTICPMRFAPALMTLTLALLTARPAMAQHQLWIRQFGERLQDIAWALAPDGVGGVVIAGYTDSELAGPNTAGLNAYAARYNKAGDQLWIRQFGHPSHGLGESSVALAPDGEGGVFVAGTTTNLGGFLGRYDATGNQLWFIWPGRTFRMRPSALAPDGAGGVILAGSTWGGGDVFLVRYNGDADLLWNRQFGTNRSESANALAPDGNGGVFVTGSTTGSLAGPIAGRVDGFLARHDSEGNQLWIRQFGTIAEEVPRALAPDGAGGVMVAGRVRLSPRVIESFVTRYDENGRELWTTQIRANGAVEANALAPDGVGGVIVAGNTNGNLGGPNAGAPDAFLARYDSEGKRLWIRQFGSGTSDEAWALAPDGAGSVVVAGRTHGSLGGPNAGSSDVFLARYTIDSCYADCDQSNGVGVLDMADFLCWQEDFMAGNSYACDCDTSTGQLVCDIFDFLCFQNAFVGGCP